MVHSVQQIKYDVLAYIKEFGGEFSEWYIGIAADPKKTLFEEHNVDESADVWLYRQALTFAACKTSVRYFCDTLQTDGNVCQPGGEDVGGEDVDCVYLYKKNERTTP